MTEIFVIFFRGTQVVCWIYAWKIEWSDSEVGEMEKEKAHDQIPLVLLLGIYFYGLSILVIKGFMFAQ